MSCGVVHVWSVKCELWSVDVLSMKHRGAQANGAAELAVDTSHFTLHTSHSILHTPRFTLHASHSTLHTHRGAHADEAAELAHRVMDRAEPLLIGVGACRVQGTGYVMDRAEPLLIGVGACKVSSAQRSSCSARRVQGTRQQAQRVQCSVGASTGSHCS